MILLVPSVKVYKIFYKFSRIFIEFPMTNNYSKFNSSHTLGLKIMKPRNYEITFMQSYSLKVQQYQKHIPISLFFFFGFDFMNFQWHFFSIFNNSCTWNLNIINHLDTPLLIKGFWTIPRTWWDMLSFAWKTNKLAFVKNKK
jgi:hypothetical protein